MHREDLPLFAGKNALPLSRLVTFRKGEPAFDQVAGRVLPLAAELVKLSGRGEAWTCCYFDEAQNLCGLYDRRPAECRALFCQDTAALAAMYDKDRLARADLLPRGHGVLAVMAEHDRLVPAGRIEPLAELLRAGGQEGLDAEAELARMALADQAFRRSLYERAGIDPEYHDFFFGRRVETLFLAAGLCLRADARLGLRVQSDPLWRGR